MRYLFIALMLFASPALAEYKMALGKPGNLMTSACLVLEDATDIMTYAKAHDGDGSTAYLQKKAQGKCGIVDSTSIGEDAAVIDKLYDQFHDALMGDLVVIEFHLIKPDGTKVTLFGFIDPAHLDNTGA